MRGIIYQVYLIAILLNTIHPATANLETTKSVGMFMRYCIYDQENAFLIAGQQLTFATINIDLTAAFEKRNNDDFTIINKIVKLTNEKLLTCGNPGIKTINKNTGATETEKFTSDVINYIILIKETEFVSTSVSTTTKLLILKLEDFSQENEIEINQSNIRMILQKGYTNFIYLGFAVSNEFISIDYTNLQKINLEKNSNQDSILSIAEERDKKHLLTCGSTAAIVKFDAIASTINKELEVPGSLQSNQNLRLILETPILIGASFISGTWFLNLDTENGGLISDKGRADYCFNPTSMMIGMSEALNPFDFFIYSFEAVTCDDSDCNECPFSSSICLQCGNSKKVKNGLCVNECSLGFYLDTNWNVCLLDRCEGGKIFEFSQNKCVTCEEKFPNCLECTSEGCSKCQDGYELADDETTDSNSCTKPGTSTIKIISIIVLSIIGGILCISLVILLIYYCRNPVTPN